MDFTVTGVANSVAIVEKGSVVADPSIWISDDRSSYKADSN
jgi:hypothetical protein